jgi:hypothetical protein
MPSILGQDDRLLGAKPSVIESAIVEGERDSARIAEEKKLAERHEMLSRVGKKAKQLDGYLTPEKAQKMKEIVANGVRDGSYPAEAAALTARMLDQIIEDGGGHFDRNFLPDQLLKNGDINTGRAGDKGLDNAIKAILAE